MALSDDVLWTIFMINATDPASSMEYRLANTRTASQTCQQWRDTSLANPSIWSKLVLITDGHGIEWTRKIIERIGDTSPLWIKATVTSTDFDPTEELFVEVLGRFLDRIQSLEVDSHSYFSASQHLKNPAPILQYLSISDSENYHAFNRWLPENLFAGQAPNLRTFSCSHCQIRMPPRWLSTITTLNISPVSAENLLDILSWGRGIQVLRLHRPTEHQDLFITDIESYAFAKMSNFILPRLAHIEAAMTLPVFNSFWSTESTSPAESYTRIHVSFPGRMIQDQQNLANFQTALHNIFHHSNGLTNYSQDMQWCFRILSTTFNIRVVSQPLQLYFNLSLSWGGIITDTSNGIHRIINSSLLPYVDNAFNFDFDIRGLVQGYIFEDFTEVLESMDKVAIVTLNSSSVKCINVIESSGHLLFPKLEKLDCNGLLFGETGYIDDLVVFLTQRLQSKQPVPSLVITDKDNDIKEVENYLINIPGVQIVN